MEDIDIINKNDFGLVFLWKRCPIEHHKKINFVFDKNVLHLNEPEVLIFSELIDVSLERLIENRRKNSVEELMFLETPVPQLSLIMDYENLVLLQNLVEGTLLELGIDEVFKKEEKYNL